MNVIMIALVIAVLSISVLADSTKVVTATDQAQTTLNNMTAEVTGSQPVSQSEQQIYLCKYTESEFIDFLAKSAADTALSSSRERKSMVVIKTANGVAYGTALDAAPAVIVVAGTAVAAYAALKAYCIGHEVSDKAVTWYTAINFELSQNMKVPIDKAGRVAKYPWRILKKGTEVVKDILCGPFNPIC